MPKLIEKIAYPFISFLCILEQSVRIVFITLILFNNLIFKARPIDHHYHRTRLWGKYYSPYNRPNLNREQGFTLYNFIIKGEFSCESASISDFNNW